MMTSNISLRKAMKFSILIFILSLTSCILVDENLEVPNECLADCTVILGKITNKNSDEVIEGVKMTLFFKFDKIGLLTLPEVRRITSTSTNSEGNYEFNFNLLPNEVERGWLSIVLEKEGFEKSVIQLFDNERNSTFERNFEMIPN